MPRPTLSIWMTEILPMLRAALPPPRHLDALLDRIERLP